MLEDPAHCGWHHFLGRGSWAVYKSRKVTESKQERMCILSLCCWLWVWCDQLLVDALTSPKWLTWNNKPTEFFLRHATFCEVFYHSHRNANRTNGQPVYSVMFWGSVLIVNFLTDFFLCVVSLMHAKHAVCYRAILPTPQYKSSPY